jgi:tyrosinase
MRQNTNPADRSSLHYWSNVHVNHCPHGTPYFIAWHRGYLYFFEQQLRIVSGDPDLNLPYWDYYSYANLPFEFTDPAPNNPLYRERMSNNVYNALSMAPFDPAVYNFQRGKWNAFEPKLENVHNPVHDLIGGIMSTMQSPLDPIFYLHHANVDRLTHAWALPDGKGIPLSAYPYSDTNSDPYWAGLHVYASDLSLERYRTLIPTWLDNDYANDNVPATLPPPPASIQASASIQGASPLRSVGRQRPAVLASIPVNPQSVSASRRSLGGVAQVPLDEGSATVVVQLNKGDAAELARIASARRTALAPGAQAPRGAITLVIDRALMIGTGREGGYYYALYLNMPAQAESTSRLDRFFVGTLGAFQIAAASHHGPAVIEYDLSDLLAQQNLSDFSTLMLSWIRVDGGKPPVGKTIHIDEVRIEVSYESAQEQIPALPKPRGWYRRRA